jgi:hypothetical protein
VSGDSSRLVLGRALTAAAGPPGALNRVMGVLVSPCILHAIPASRPSHNLTIMVPCSARLGKIPYAPLLLLECSHTACGEKPLPTRASLCAAHRTLATTHILTRPEPASVRQACEREMALTGIGRGGARRRSIRLATTEAGCLSCFNSVSSKDQQTPAPVT